MISLEPDLCILIATKDRPEKLNLLLNSISESTLLPKKIIIVYSGSEISNLINIYTNIPFCTTRNYGKKRLRKSFWWL